MPLRIVYGRAGSGKSEYLLDEIAALQKQSERAILLVPEQFSHRTELRIVDKIGFLSAQAQSLSFKRMALHAAKEYGENRTRLDNCGRSMVLTRVLHRLRRELVFYGRISGKPGFVGELCTFLTELKKGCVTPTDLAQQAERAEGTLHQKLTDLSKIYTDYEEALARRVLDTDDLLAVLARLIAEKRAFAGVHIYLDEFVKLTAQERACVRALLANGNPVTAAVVTDSLAVEECGFFAPAAGTAHQLSYDAAELGQPVLSPVALREIHRFCTPELQHLERGLYRFGAEGYPGEPKHITVQKAATPYAEVTLLAAAIRRTVREQGLHYRDIAVIAGDLESYRELVRTVFPSYQIPVFTDQTSDVLSHPIILMLTAALDCVINAFRTEDVLSYLKSGFSGLTAEEVDELENAALERAIRGKDWLDDARFAITADNVFGSEAATGESETARIVANKNRALAPLFRLKEQLGANRAADGRAAALEQFLAELCLESVLEAKIAELEAIGELQAAQRYSEVYGIMTEVLSQLAVGLGDEKIGLEQLRDALTNGFAQYSFGTIPPSLDEVFLGDMTRSRVKNVRALFVVGAVEGTFPPRLAESGLLTDAERASLIDAGLALAPDTQARTLDARLTVYQTMTIATHSITVSYPAADLDGKGLRPSRLVGQLLTMFPALRVKDAEIGGENSRAEEVVASPESAYRYVLPYLSLPNVQYRAAFDALCTSEPWRERLERAQKNSRFHNDVGRLSPAQAHRLYGGSLHGSVSRFEDYSRCPYSYFLKYGLKAKERRVLKLNTPDTGWLLHEVVEMLSQRLAEQGLGFGTVEEETSGKLVDEIIDGLTRRMFLKKLYAEKKFETLIRRLKRLVMRSVLVICEHVRAGQFEPCAFEFTFGEDGDIPPVTVELPTGDSVTLTGRIDRIDRYTVGDTAYIKIIDYKSGSKEFSLSDIYNRLSLQLAVYVDAVWENGQGRLGGEVCPAGMFYFRLMDPIMRTASIPDDESWKQEMFKQFRMTGLLLDNPAVRGAIGGEEGVIPIAVKRDGSPANLATMEQFRRLKDYIRRTVGEIGQAILEGDIQLAPYYNGTSKPCDYCSFSAVCGFDPNENQYRMLRTLAPEEIWQRLGEPAEGRE